MLYNFTVGCFASLSGHHTGRKKPPTRAANRGTWPAYRRSWGGVPGLRPAAAEPVAVVGRRVAGPAMRSRHASLRGEPAAPRRAKVAV